MSEDLQFMTSVYEIVTEDGEFCASSSDYADAMHYAMVYAQDGPVLVYRVVKTLVSAVPPSVIDARVGFDLAHLYQLCEEAEGKDLGIITVPDKITALIDEIEALRSDLDSAIEVAFKRGATEWTRLNYPDHYERLTASSSSASQ